MQFTKENIPQKSGWYWVLIKNPNEPKPCWFMYCDEPKYSCFLPGGLGDSSSMGLYQDYIETIGPEINVPIF